MYKIKRAVELTDFLQQSLECPAGRVQFSVHTVGVVLKQGTLFPPHPDRAVNLPYKSVWPWGRTGCLPSYLSSTIPTRRVTGSFKQRHICRCHVGA